jgi:signal transduction histidine kinase
MASKLRESVDNSSNALENLLLWSKKQLTGITTRVVDIHLLPQVWQMESHLKPNLQAKNIRLSIRVPDFYKIKGDMNQLDICLKNLVNNAIKFTEPGGEIIVSAFEQGDYDVVQVKDNGVGMDQEQLEKLRDATQDFSTLGTMSEKGTGLGVMLVSEFMNSQNGRLRIESVKGEGSTFSLLFPKDNKDYRQEKKKKS